VRAHSFNGRLHCGLLVDGEVIEHHDIAGPQRGDEHLLDVGEKRRIVDRPIEYRGSIEAVQPQGGNHRVRLPVPARGVIADPQAAGTARVATEQIRSNAGFVDEHVLARIAEWQPVLPAAARRGDISAALFVGVYRFF
jgi:hypothetical protein